MHYNLSFLFFSFASYVRVVVDVLRRFATVLTYVSLERERERERERESSVFYNRGIERGSEGLLENVTREQRERHYHPITR